MIGLLSLLAQARLLLHLACADFVIGGGGTDSTAPPPVFLRYASFQSAREASIASVME